MIPSQIENYPRGRFQLKLILHDKRRKGNNRVIDNEEQQARRTQFKFSIVAENFPQSAIKRNHQNVKILIH